MINRYIPVVSQVANQLNSNVIVCTPPPPFLQEGGLSLQIFKKGGLDSTSTFRGGCWERGGNFFQGVAIVT